MIAFETEYLDRDMRHIKYRVSLDGDKVSIDSNGPDGLDVFEVRGTWKDYEVIVTAATIGDPLDYEHFLEETLERIESEISEEIDARHVEGP